MLSLLIDSLLFGEEIGVDFNITCNIVLNFQWGS